MKSLKVLVCLLATAGTSVAMTGCRAAPDTPSEKRALKSESQGALDRLYAWAPDMRPLLEQAHGYVVFPSIGKAGLVVGGAYGRGEVYRQGEMIGFADITQATVGPQVGAQEFAEFIIFQNEAAMRRFLDDDFGLAANASAVIIKEGAGASVPYNDGVAVVVMPSSGAMAEATVGGQKFDFISKEEATTRRSDGETRTGKRTSEDGTEVDVDVDTNRDNNEADVNIRNNNTNRNNANPQ